MLPFAHLNFIGDHFMERLSFTAHPASVGETYFEHLRSAVGFSQSMIFGGIACLVHAIFPFLFTTTGSSVIRQLHERMITKRTRCPTSDREKV
jgi:Family of unknown function (DUF6356)